ncbi:MAG: translocation/assembly module TamB domain-containing protein [Pigmentiphaga sp.]|uniref:translocation/assembly module TamB domain-containing protein n=1 Tax=Pigmentiphaga sp. TaxID=1977564 RepID=UPI00299F975E|nr:translocation/assembly module TamB domain-containing protein [Pigmentiphaga sp.]MDX3906565.1 translocation/assembly module TamB domain-containing protein [Pigmentiphaga sp.]
MNQPASPEPKLPKRRRWPWVVAGAAVLGMAAVAGFVGWAAGTAGGAAWAVRTGTQLAGGSARIEGVQGSLLAGLSVDTLEIRLPTLDADVEGMRLDVRWRALRGGRLHVSELSARRARLGLRSSDEPSEPLTSLRLPLAADVDKLAIGTLDIDMDGERLPASFAGIDLRATSTGTEHRVLLANLGVSAPQAQATLRGEASLGAEAPFPIKLALNANGLQQARPFDFGVTASGSLQELEFSVRGDGAGVDVDARGQAALLGGFPLRGLTLQLAGIDPAAWVSGAPAANLGLTAKLAVEPGSGPALLRGPVSLTNSTPRRLDEDGVPVAGISGQVSVPVETFDALDVSRLVIELAGGGRLAGQLQWRRAAQSNDVVGHWEGRVEVANVDASRIHGAALPTRLAGTLAFSADAAEQSLNAELADRSRKVPLSLRLAAQMRDEVLQVSRLELAAGEARAQGKGELQLAEPRRFAAALRLDRFDPGHWVRSAVLPPAKVSARADVKGALMPSLGGSAQVRIDNESRWNGEPLGGHADLAFAGTRVTRVDAALTAGTNRLQARGAFGHVGDRLDFDLDAPRLQTLSSLLHGRLMARGKLGETLEAPVLDMTLEADDLQLPGDVRVGHVQGRANLGTAAGGRSSRGGFAAAPADVDLRIEKLALSAAPQATMSQATLRLTGTMAQHEGTVDAEFVPADQSAPATLAMRFAGGWGNGGQGRRAAAPGWRGTLASLELARSSLGISLQAPVTLSYVPGLRAPQWQWEVGPTEIALQLPGGQRGKLIHDGSRGGDGRWESRGRAEGLAWAPDILLETLAGKPVPPDRMVVLDADWDLRFAGSLQGSAAIRRRSGDLWVPGTPPMALGLRTLEASLRAMPDGNGGRSRIALHALIEGERLGQVRVDGEAGILASGGGFGLDKERPAHAEAQVDVHDLSWLGLFVGDSVELGGKVAGSARVVQQGGQWRASGGLQGEGIRIVRLDDGVRLLDGTLKATLEDDRIVLDSLRFPSVIRVNPRDSRVQEWIKNESRDGSLEITADWRMSQASGHATLKADRFPAIQRADRFIAGSGRVDMDIIPDRMRIAGLFEVDTGWVDLGTQAPATLSDDVYVRHSGKEPQKKTLGIAIDVGVKLGNGFYLRGYGLDTGVTGDLRLVGMVGALSSSGTVRTRGGRFDAYGQTLTVRRGVLTFQGPIDDPLLDIVAVRVGPRVEAGVRVSGTARRPRIALVSTPEVSDVEKLSWLLLGRGPDEGGGGADATLLLSAATSLLGPQGSEPISRQLGLDEIGVRSGNVGSSRGLLPDRTVAGDSTSSANTLSNTQFMVVGKRLTDRLYASFEQALSGRDGVVKLSYRLTNRLSAVAKGGTLNGLDLLYFVLFDD